MVLMKNCSGYNAYKEVVLEAFRQIRPTSIHKATLPVILETIRGLESIPAKNEEEAFERSRELYEIALELCQALVDEGHDDGEIIQYILDLLDLSIKRVLPQSHQRTLSQNDLDFTGRERT